MKIIITSSGIGSEDFKKKFAELIGRDISELKMLHDTTAIDGEPVESDKSWAEEEFQNILRAGFKPENITEHKIDQENEDLSGYDVVYVQGGNTFYLMKMMRKYHFDQSVKDALNGGVIYIGSSAGSMVLGDTIETAFSYSSDSANTYGVADFTGIGLVEGAIFPHVNQMEKKVERDKKKFDKCYLLRDGGGVFFVDGQEVAFRAD